MDYSNLVVELLGTEIAIRRVVDSIKNNAKRMAKLRSLNGNDARNQAEKYVVAECQAQHFKLRREDIITATVLVTKEA